jgi:serine/threonine protein kinase
LAAGSPEPAAVKFLIRSGRERRQRFGDEVAFLLSAPGRPGVIPILEADLEAEPPYFVMPLATPLREHLRPEAEANAVLRALLEVATTLADLASEGVSHRDLKPDNLLVLNDAVLLADFGLVAYPDKQPLTRQGRRLGALDYMAPEMRADADRAHPARADVYSLGKVLWVLLTDRDLPLPGQHQASDPLASLRTYLEHPRIAQLDALIEAATRLDPSKRPTMHEFATELSLALQQPPEAGPVPDLSDIALRLSELAGAAGEAHARRAAPLRQAEAILNRLHEYLLPIHLDQLSRIEGLSADYGHGFGIYTLLAPHTPIDGMVHNAAMASVLRLPSLPPPGEVFLASIGMEFAEPDFCRLMAGYGVISAGRCETTWTDDGTARLGSAALEDLMTRLGAGLRQRLPEALAALARSLGGEPS